METLMKTLEHQKKVMLSHNQNSQHAKQVNHQGQVHALLRKQRQSVQVTNFQKIKQIKLQLTKIAEFNLSVMLIQVWLLELNALKEEERNLCKYNHKTYQ